MDVKKAGAFLAQLRKERDMTQEQLGEKLGVTNKTVSRWENGNYLPPVEVLQLLSELYGLSINEILSGQRLQEADYREKAEENIKSALDASAFTLKEKMDFYAAKWDKEHRLGNILGIGLTVAAALVLFAATKESLWITGGYIVGLALCLYRRNQKMAYVERHAFDGSGRQ